MTSRPSGNSGNSVEFGHSDQVLMGSKNKRNYKKIAIYSIIGAIVIVVIVLAVVLTTGNNESEQRQLLSVEDFLGGRFRARRDNTSWLSGQELIYRDIEGRVVKYNVETEQTSTLLIMDNVTFPIPSNFESISPDGKYVLTSKGHQQIFRHSTAAFYDVVDIETKQVYPLTVGGNQSLLILATWSPIDNGIIFVKDNNIYYKPNVDHIEIPITNDGALTIYNGVCDWVYEEEVFSSKRAFWVSPDGSKLAFVRFDDANVALMQLPVYGTPGSLDFRYPQNLVIPYPKAGTPNPTVKLLEVSLSVIIPGEPLQVVERQVPNQLQAEDHIISIVTWLNNDTLLSVWMNRVQNRAYFQVCRETVCNVIKSEISTTGWLELFDTPLISANGSEIAILLSHEQGDSGGYAHLTLISTVTGETVPLTSGRFIVKNILHWDHATNTIFYTANTEEQPYIQHVYGIKADRSQASQCLTCNIELDGVLQTYFTALFSEANNLVLITDGPSVPRVDLHSWSVNADNIIQLNNLTVWETNEELREFVTDKAVPLIEHLSIPINDEFNATIKLQIPVGADLSGSTKYPLIVDVYAGPNSYAGYDRFEIRWGSYYASNRSAIFAQINGRGSGERGDRLLHTLYRALGTVEIEDQIAITKKLQETLPYIDASRTAIWGWSYGGYAAGMALSSDTQGVFKCGASVAPVTDWTYYDTIYTERYMGLPTAEDNLAGYERSLLSTRANSFRGKQYYLVHGTLDDNVHYQQAMALSRSLELNDVPFLQMSYPDEAHGLSYVQRHLYHSLDRFFDDCFDLSHD